MISKCQSKRTLLQRKYLESQGIPWLSCYSWEQRKVGEVSKRVIVGLATSVTPYYREEGVPILRNLNIKENYLDDTDILFLDRPYAESQVSKQIHAGDVLTVHTGYIGISCVVPEKYDNCLTFTTLITTTDDAVLEGAFLAQYLNSEIGMSAVQAVTTQGGRQNLNTNDFVKVEIRYPSLAEQSKICAVLSRIDNLITLHQRQRKNSMRNCSCLPFSWEQRKLGDLGSVSMCRRIFKHQTSESGEIPFFKIGTFGGEPDAFITRELFEEFKAKYPYPDKGDILISASGSIGRTVEFTGENEYFQDSNIVWLKHDKSIINPFLRHLYSVVEWAGIEGSTIKRLYNDNILKTEVMLPSVQEQTKIAEMLDGIDSLITLHQREQIFINLEVHDVRSGKKHRFIL